RTLPIECPRPPLVLIVIKQSRRQIAGCDQTVPAADVLRQVRQQCAFVESKLRLHQRLSLWPFGFKYPEVQAQLRHLDSLRILIHAEDRREDDLALLTHRQVKLCRRVEKYAIPVI